MDEARDRTWWGKGKKDSWRHHDSEFIKIVDRIHKHKASKLNHVSFDKIIKMLCHNHDYLVKHTLQDYDQIKRYLKDDYKNDGPDAPSGFTNNKGKRDSYPDPKGCLMIFGGPVA